MSSNLNFKEFFNHYEINSTSDDIQRYYLLWKSVIAQAMTDAASHCKKNRKLSRKT